MLQVLMLSVCGICPHRKRTSERARQTSAEFLPADTPSKENGEMRLVATTWNNIYQVQFFPLEGRWAIDQGSVPGEQHRQSQHKSQQANLLCSVFLSLGIFVAPLPYRKGKGTIVSPDTWHFLKSHKCGHFDLEALHKIFTRLKKNLLPLNVLWWQV